MIEDDLGLVKFVTHDTILQSLILSLARMETYLFWLLLRTQIILIFRALRIKVYLKSLNKLTLAPIHPAVL